jgi:ureidoacrylate peracid hydrolase
MKVCLDARPEKIEMELRSAALVVVDMQNTFTSEGGVFSLSGIDISLAGTVVHIVGRIIDRVRLAKIQVVYLQMGYREDLSDSGGPGSPNWHKELALRLMRDRPETCSRSLTENTWDFEIREELKPKPGDLVVVKSRYSGFAGTNLDSLLRSHGIRYLIFTGMATNVCVESTLRDAYCRDYWPVLVTDATLQAGPPSLQQAAVRNVENHFGWTIDSESLLEALDPTNG